MIKKVHINEGFMIMDDEEEMQYEVKVIKIDKNYKLEIISNPEIINQDEV